MADLIAIVILGVQYSLVAAVVKLFFGVAISIEIFFGVFIVFAALSVAIWRGRGRAKSAWAWGIPALASVPLGVGFFGCDWLMAYIHGQPNPSHFSGGPLGLTLTFLVCPVATMVCVAGCARALYLNRKEHS